MARFNYDKGTGLLQGLYAALDSYMQADRENKREKRAGLLAQQQQADEDAKLRAEKGLIAKRADGAVTYEEDPAFKQRQLQDQIQKAALKGEIINPDGSYGGLTPKRMEQELALRRAEAEARVTPVESQIKQAQLKKAQKEASAIGTPEQVKAATFGKRIEQGLNVLDKLEKEGYDRTSLTETAKAATGGLLGAGAKGKLSQQQQAEDNILAAILRRESGANITKEERAQGEMQYFPRRGDTPESKAQKRQNLEQVLLSLQAESAGAWSAIPNAPMIAPQPSNAPLSPQEWLKQRRGQK